MLGNGRVAYFARQFAHALSVQCLRYRCLAHAKGFGQLPCAAVRRYYPVVFIIHFVLTLYRVKLLVYANMDDNFQLGNYLRDNFQL
jgi:hypothetical protein